MIGKITSFAVAGVSAALIGIGATGNSASALTVTTPGYGLTNNYSSNYSYSSSSNVSYSSTAQLSGLYGGYYGGLGCGNLYGGYYGGGLYTNCGNYGYYF